MFNCARYKLYDWFKQTALASKLFYYGQRYQHFNLITVTGTVVDCVHQNPDGDTCFDVLAETKARWHCEATPCSSDALKAQIASIKGTGVKVKISGVATHDPDHHLGPKKFIGGHDEIHPVSSIEVLT